MGAAQHKHYYDAKHFDERMLTHGWGWRDAEKAKKEEGDDGEDEDSVHGEKMSALALGSLTVNIARYPGSQVHC